MSKGRLKEKDHKCIQRNYLFIKENIEALYLLDYLFQSEVITLDDKEKISQGKNQSERNEYLLMTILNSGPGDAFNHFIKSLERQYKHVKERILRLDEADEIVELNQPDFKQSKAEYASTRARPFNRAEKAAQLYEVDCHDSACAASLRDQDLNCEGRHNEMIAEDQFTIEHLPTEYRQRDIFELTKAIASLTVRLLVKHVSDTRPTYFPNTSIPFPLYDKRGQDFCSNGSGRISDVEEQNKVFFCRCMKCINSDSPSRKWWSIKIFTSVSVVFDNDEARNTSCSVFQEDTNLFSTLQNCKMLWKCDESDLCLIEAACCDEMLCNKIFSVILHLNKIWKGLHKIFKHLESKTERLIIVVSYVHGLRKCISIGGGVNLGKLLGLGFDRFIYNAPVCDGCTGGPVYALGMNWYKEEYVHSGHENARDIAKLVADFNKHLDLESRALLHMSNHNELGRSSIWRKE
ncbi:hypothetical protein BgiMline_031607 [Biomphalaria glabrata]|uniref:Uncharacterized protein LOC106071167 isoform X1 n=1 Tax=Biomphalaria glabrata TaxID=6526 RepID=A0A9U8EGC9_BIOGL|nr:uncharacterized protein LOC106071167 isoform X1 [Biomphalaria glabrata]KAI8746105.1 hypothetical protein BgiMline_019821 [Biomphalaria glabrata]